jgi:hypothetical protein
MAWKDDFGKYGVCPFCKRHLTKLAYIRRGEEGGDFYKSGEERSRWTDTADFELHCPECGEDLMLDCDQGMEFLRGINYRIVTCEITEEDLEVEQSAAKLMGGAGI